MGYESENIIKNLGSMILYLVGFVSLAIFTIALKLIKDKHRWLDAIYNFLYNMLFWNMILRLILEGYLEFAINSVTNLQDMKWNNTSDHIASIFAISTFIVVIVFPFFVWHLLWRN
jgi:hypothetical protein